MSFPIVGVVGGGQLARMMAPFALELGIELRILAESEDVSAVAAVPNAPVGDYRDLSTLREFAQGVDVLTFDHEHVPTEHLQQLVQDGVAVHPDPEALIYAQDKLKMRSALERLGLTNPQWASVSSPESIIDFASTHGWPVILKTPRGGYDGKGVQVLRSPEDAVAAAEWFTGFPELLVEEMVPFTRELSAMVARTPSGEVRAWPVVESIQVAGVCDEVIAPAPDLDPEIAQAAQEAAITVATELGVTGVMAVEMFQVPGGFLINELAMRPHNSGHWSMDGAVTGQFEQHLRAVLDLPLGDPSARSNFTVMKNFLGGENIDLYSAFPAALRAESAAKVHVYGKSVKPGRKIGHVNAFSRDGETLAEVRRRANTAALIIRDGEQQ